MTALMSLAETHRQEYLNSEQGTLLSTHLQQMGLTGCDTYKCGAQNVLQDFSGFDRESFWPKGATLGNNKVVMKSSSILLCL